MQRTRCLMPPVLTVLLILLVIAPALGAQQITGRVTNGQTGEPLAAVQVFIAGSGIGALTQQNGRYLLLNRLDWFEAVRPPELAVLLVELPGYGWSEGEPSTETVGAAFSVAHDWLSARPEIDRSKIIGYGRSLGAGAICTLIGQKPLAALVLSSAFTSLAPLAWRMLAPPMLLRDRFDNLEAVKRFDGPVLVIHGTRDEVIPYAHGKELAAASPRARLISYPAGHNDCPPDAAAFAADFTAFLKAHALIAR